MSGKAVCFDGQAEAIKGIVGGRVKAGDVVELDMKVQRWSWNARDACTYKFNYGNGTWR